uniref:Glutamate-gated chloride channel n=1 Tax=Meloidogyne incognita TaxID=6306 RepID=A0A914L9P3_MELIC
MFLDYSLLLLAFLNLFTCSTSKQQPLSVNSFWNFEENAKRSERSVEVKLLDEEELLSITRTTPTSSLPEKTNLPIGIKIEALGPEGRESLRQQLLYGEDDKELDEMLNKMESISRQGGVKPLPSGVLEPMLNKTGYDPRSAPQFIQGRPVEVRVGILVQSIANFQLATMDYDMDCWLRMSWRDPRLALNLTTPILVNDEIFLKKIWRPDMHFVNARDSLFHRVTRLNFYAFVFPMSGKVFLEARLYVKPKSQLILCKYPHDSQTLQLRISSIASTNDSVSLRWFSRQSDAIRIYKRLQLPELYIAGLEKKNCQTQRKTGNFSCLEARFLMKRSIGYHLWQTYVPTATCVLFSWISVWLPEEFVEGRVFVALTVFLTLSAESSSAKETLPKVSYVKAIDVWFGFTSVFVFCTMLQALIVIGLEHRSRQLKKIATEEAAEISAYKISILLSESQMHHRNALRLDTFFKVMYPVIFIIFLFIYVFVVIEGEENKCLQNELNEQNNKHVEL